MPTAIVTVAIGTDYQELAALTHPTFAVYAKRVGADFVPLTGVTDGDPHFAKFGCFELLASYDRVLFVDTDTIIAPECPNVFELVPEDHFGAYLVSKDTSYHDQAIELIQREIRDIGWSQIYFNSGVMIASRQHRQIFDMSDKDFATWERVCAVLPEHKTFSDQTYLNYKVQEALMPLADIGYRFNHSLGPGNSGDRFSSHIIHCKGHRRGPKVTEIKRARFVIDRPVLRRVLAGAPFLTRLYDKVL